MASSSSSSSGSSSTGNDASKQLQGEQRATGLTMLKRNINVLKKEIQAERVAYVQEKIMKNKEMVESAAASHHMSASNRGGSENKLELRMRFPMKIIPAKDQRSLAQDNNNEEVDIPVTATLPPVKKLPPYTTWVPMSSNQKRNDEQSVVAPCEEKYAFSEGEKRIIRMVRQSTELSEEVVQTLAQSIGRTTTEIREELIRLGKEDEEAMNQDVIVPAEVKHDEPTDPSTDVDHLMGQESVASSDGRIADGTHSKSNKQYAPCGCISVCGKDCTCLNNSTCCEKYCGCLTSCKNRFRGCHCAKNECRSEQCPCFAAGRECDPDICGNCWVSCGDGSLGEPKKRGQGQCGNMRLLLRQQQRNTVEKGEYLGVYTSELISQEEADLRGQLHDSANPSSHFNLNDQHVIDALHQRKKLKFANHSPDPNCHASIKKVGGDHRVGKFTKKRNQAGEEILYDYYYEPEYSPFLPRKPDDAKKQIEAGEEIYYHYCHGPNQPEYSPFCARKPDDAKKQIEAGEEICYDYCYEPEQSPLCARKPEDAEKQIEEDEDEDIFERYLSTL